MINAKALPLRLAVLAVAVGCVLAGCASGGGGGAGAESGNGTTLVPLTLAAGAAKSSMASAVFVHGLEQGIFEKHGLDLEVEYVTPAAAQAALLAGEVDVAYDGDELMRSVAAAGEGKVFMTSGTLPFAIFADSPLTVPELRGRTISSTTPGSSFSSALVKTLEGAGLDPATDVDVVYLQTVAAQYAALQAGNVDAVLLSPPATVKARQDGFSKVADIADNTSPAVFAASGDALSARRDAVVRFAAAMVEATESARDNRAELTKSLVAASSDIDPGLVEGSIDEAAPRWEIAPYPAYWAETIMAASPDADLRATPLTEILDTTIVDEVGALAPQAAQ